MEAPLFTLLNLALTSAEEVVSLGFPYLYLDSC